MGSKEVSTNNQGHVHTALQDVDNVITVRGKAMNLLQYSRQLMSSVSPLQMPFSLFSYNELVQFAAFKRLKHDISLVMLDAELLQHSDNVFVLISVLSAVAQLPSAPATTKWPNIDPYSVCAVHGWFTKIAFGVNYTGKQWCVLHGCSSCFYLWFLMHQQTLVQVGESSIHRLSNPFVRGVVLPRLSVCHALVPIWLHAFLQSHELSRCELYAPPTAPHRHRLPTTKTWVISNFFLLKKQLKNFRNIFCFI